MMQARSGAWKISSVPSESEIRALSIQAGEWWWGGAVADGQLMPFGRAPHRRNGHVSRVCR